MSDESDDPIPSFGLRRLSKGALIYTISNGLQSATSVIVMPLLFKHLSVGAYGEYGLLMSFLAIALALVVLGMDGAVGRMFFDAPDLDGRRRIMGTLLPLQCLLTVALTLTLDVSVAAAVDGIAGISYDPVIRLTLWTAAATAIFNGVAAFWRSGERPLRVAVANFASFGCTIAGISYFLIVRQMGLTGVMLGMLSGRAVVALTMLAMGLRETGVRFDATVSRKALIFALPLVPHVLFGWVYRSADRWLLAHLFGNPEVGIYVTSYLIAAVITMLVSSANEAIAPRFLSLYAEGGPDAARAFHRRIYPYFCWGAFAVGAAMILGGPWIIRILSSGKVTPVPLTTAFLVGGIVAHGLYYPFASALTALKHTGRIMALTLLTGSLNIALNLLLTPRYAGTGAAAAFLISHVSLLLMVAGLANMRFGALPFVRHTLAGALVLAATAWLVNARLWG